MSNASIASFEGFGLGLRPPHYPEFLGGQVPVDFVEVISENFMVKGGKPLNVLAAIRERYPVALHGVSMSIGSADGIKLEYLNRLKALADRVKPLWVSDHLCWTGLEGYQLARPVAASLYRGGAAGRMRQCPPCAGCARAPVAARKSVNLPAICRR